MINLNEYKRWFADQLDEEVVSLIRLGGGHNSQTYRIACRSGRSVAAKIYHRHSADPRDRLAVEFRTLSFLWNHGIREIPQPLIENTPQGFALYQFVAGEAIDVVQIKEMDIDRTVDFLVSLNTLKNDFEAADLPSASEACFSCASIVENIKGRFDRLLKVPTREIFGEALHQFLNGQFKPLFERVIPWSESLLERNGLSLKRPLPLAERTLSPSDFGFHNALRLKDGRLIFLDFEYFGWDDPAKMILDFVLHPAMNLPHQLKERFVKKMINHFDPDGPLPLRLKAFYPLFGLKWGMILLNEFVGEDWSRRQFAAPGVVDIGEKRAHQLLKAEKMLSEIEGSYENRSFSSWPAGYPVGPPK
ncbi:MAG: phosphotransferase [Deltaproteobacteria bacterium]|nr:phosphotransferase [Deltaproteobacteria bacterium]